jgi:hypothetical protein
MILGVMPPPMPADPERQLKSLARSYCGTLICQQLKHSTASHQNFNYKTFRIIHPFHPYRNIEFQVDSIRRLAYEHRVLFFNPKGRRSSVPLDWTDIGPKDPFVVVSAGRSLFRVEDLLGLVGLIAKINRAKRQ